MSITCVSGFWKIKNKHDNKYDDWFKNIPEKWEKIGELYLGKTRITPDKSSVSFFITSKNEYFSIVEKLNDFVNTLPQGVIFTFENTGHSQAERLL